MPKGLLLPYCDPTTVDIPASNTASLVINLSGQLTVIRPDASINPVLNPVSQHDSALAAGNLTVNPTGVIHTEQIAVSGSARTSQILVSTVGLGASSSGNRCTLLFSFAGQPAAIILQVYSSNSGGPLLVAFETDGIQNNAVAFLYYDNSLGQWVLDLQKMPAGI